MRKILLLPSFIFLFCCQSDDFDNIQKNDIPNSTQFHEKGIEVMVNSQLEMDMIFDREFPHGDGGCEFLTFNFTGTETYMSKAAFGPNPIERRNFVDGQFKNVRGFGKPILSYHYTGLLMRCGNKHQTITNPRTGQTSTAPVIGANAISFEHDFKANYTYDVLLTFRVRDQIYVASNDTYNNNDDQYGIPQSESFPYIAVELRDSPEIPGSQPCQDPPYMGAFPVIPNYYEKYKIELENRMSEVWTMAVTFSTLHDKKAVVIYTLPDVGNLRESSLRSDFSFYLRNVKVIKKPFNPNFVDNGNPRNHEGIPPVGNGPRGPRGGTPRL